jgi:membrane-associated protein
MELLKQFYHLFAHLDQTLNSWAIWAGPWLYVLLFVIVFCETGLVVTPFLPGDSLLFAVGALTASEGSVISLPVVIVVLIAAGVIGDAVNYSIGKRFGERAFRSETSRLFNKKHLIRTQRFYAEYGGKTIIIARFIPIIRTFAPFVAGMGTMRYARFAAFNVIGAVTWVVGFTVLGRVFGNLPIMKKNFQYVILAIIVLSVLPAVIEILRERARSRRGERPADNPT